MEEVILQADQARALAGLGRYAAPGASVASTASTAWVNASISAEEVSRTK